MTGPPTDGSGGASFEKLLEPHVARLYRLAFRLTGRVHDAEDLVQDVLIKAFDRRSELTSIEALGPWLCRVLYNAFVDDARRFARGRLRAVPLAETAEPVAAPDGSTEIDRAFDIRALTAALEKLSPEHRSVLLMHDSEGYKLNEIQLITGIPLGTLKSRLHRARARLRELLGDAGTF